MRKLFRKFVCIHITVARNEKFCSVFFHKLHKPRPLVFYPYCIKIFRFSAYDKHHLRCAECGKYVRFILCTEFVFQCYRRIKNFEALVCQLIVNVIGNCTVNRTFSVFIRLFVADKNVKRLLVLYYRKYVLLYTINRVSL